MAFRRANRSPFLHWLLFAALFRMLAAFSAKPRHFMQRSFSLVPSVKPRPSAALRIPPRSALGEAIEATAATSLLISRIDLQGTRDLVQGAFYSLVSTLPVRVGAGLVGALASGSLLVTFTDVVEKGKERAGTAGGELVVAQLYLCILVDLLGDASYFVPGVGEFEDLLWAPVSAALLLLVFKSRRVAVLDFAKELLPFVDIVPVATLSWLLQHAYPESAAAKALSLSPTATTDSQEDI